MFYEENLQEKDKENKKKISCFVYDTIKPGFPNHCHTHLELIYIIEGKIEIFIDGKSKMCQKGDLVFIPMLKPHAISDFNHLSSKHIILQVSPELLKDNTDFTDQSILSLGEKIESKISVKINNENILKILLKMQHISEDIIVQDSFMGQDYTYDKNKVENVWKLKGLVFELFSYLLEDEIIHFSTNNDKFEDLNELSCIQPVLQHMINQPEENISMEKGAEIANMSYYNFSRTFKRLLGYSFVNYKNLLRIRYAEELLHGTSKSITEIASLLNFGNISYFNRIFKKINKMNPSEYRNKYVRK
jgi:AraC-like DNA-binding protein/mannose-6-phosphate isomerase-like protein (cupin superfamily)